MTNGKTEARLPIAVTLQTVRRFIGFYLELVHTLLREV
jgi:hypothetical protein